MRDDGCLVLQSGTKERLVDMPFQNNYTGLYFNIVTIQVRINSYIYTASNHHSLYIRTYRKLHL